MGIRMNHVEKELLENLDVTKLYAFDNPRRILFGLGRSEILATKQRDLDQKDSSSQMNL